MARVYLGLGSNVRPEFHLALAARELGERFCLLEVSAVYRNKALGFDGEPFLNAVAAVRTELSPQEVHGALEEIHRVAGRVRGMDAMVARTLDIDLLLYDDAVIDAGKLRVPRKDILEYSFVLRPLAEIAPNLVHPLTGKSMAVHWAEFDRARHPLQQTELRLHELR